MIQKHNQHSCSHITKTRRERHQGEGNKAEMEKKERQTTPQTTCQTNQVTDPKTTPSSQDSDEETLPVQRTKRHRNSGQRVLDEEDDDQSETEMAQEPKNQEQ